MTLISKTPLWVSLSHATFAVQPAGRDKVRREGRKNVHAFVRGDLITSTAYHTISSYMYQYTHEKMIELFVEQGFRKATYNPYQNDTFVDVETGEPVLKADAVELDTELGVWYR